MSIWIPADTETKVRIGPAVAVGDGFTPVTTLSLAAADETQLLKADGAAAVDLSGATFAAVTNADGWYDLTLTTSHTDTEGELVVVIHDDSLILPIYAKFMVVAINTHNVLVKGSDRHDVNVAEVQGQSATATDAVDFDDLASIKTKTDSLTFTVANQVDSNVQAVSDDATAATNLEAAYDGTGYDVGGIDVSELNAIIDDLIDGGRLDVLIDAIKAKTDDITFTVANQVDVNTVSINETEVKGTGISSDLWRG